MNYSLVPISFEFRVANLKFQIANGESRMANLAHEMRRPTVLFITKILKLETRNSKPKTALRRNRRARVITAELRHVAFRERVYQLMMKIIVSLGHFGLHALVIHLA